MHGCTKQLVEAYPVDARHLQVECPLHRGLMIPVTEIIYGFAPRGDESRGRHHARGYLQAFCRICGKYHHLRMQEGSRAELPPLVWNE